MGFQVCSCQHDYCNIDYDTCCDTYKAIELEDLSEELSTKLMRTKKLTQKVTIVTSTKNKIEVSSTVTKQTNIIIQALSTINCTKIYKLTRTSKKSFEKINIKTTKIGTTTRTFGYKIKFFENVAIYIFKLVIMLKYFFNGMIEFLKT